MVYLPRDLTRIESKYSLVVAVAKRARQIVSRKEPSLSEGRKPVTIALEEIASGRIRVVPKKVESAEDETGHNLSDPCVP
ncbi:MAG: DNA-directed RNA polymerase subunit omega [Bacillota bacterium]